MNLGKVWMLGFGLLVLAGCSPPVKLAPDFGRSVTLVRDNQVLHPEAQANLEPVYGMDGIGADQAVQRYRASFEKEEGTSLEIGVLTISGN